MIVLDASVLIAHLEATDPHHLQATELLLAHRDHEFRANTITIAEILVGAVRADQVDLAHHALSALDIQVHSIAADAGLRLAELRVQTGLKLPDCCVLYTAECHPGSLFASFDARLTAAANNLGLGLGH